MSHAFINVPEITIADAKHYIKDYIRECILYETYDMELPVFLWSLCGIGKTSVVRQAVCEVSRECNVPIEVRIWHLGQCSLYELQGVMDKDTKKGTARYYASPFYDKPKQKDAVVVYFLDEMDKTSGELRKAALQILSERKFLMFSLPEKSILIGAGNPEEADEGLFTVFADELNNRLSHFRVKPDFEVWKKWAEGAGIHLSILRFLSSQRQYFYYRGEKDKRLAARPTARTWEKLSDYLKRRESPTIDDEKDSEQRDYDSVYPRICSFIGTEAALAFLSFCKSDWDFPDMRDIVNGTYSTVPENPDTKNILITSLLAYVEDEGPQIKQVHWENICSYINSFPADFAALFYKSVIAMGDPDLPLLSSTSFRNWSLHHGDLLTNVPDDFPFL